jgi:hypothetical protein
MIEVAVYSNNSVPTYTYANDRKGPHEASYAEKSRFVVIPQCMSVHCHHLLTVCSKDLFQD